jgi:hypothetical protein
MELSKTMEDGNTILALDVISPNKMKHNKHSAKERKKKISSDQKPLRKESG